MRSVRCGAIRTSAAALVLALALTLSSAPATAEPLAAEPTAAPQQTDTSRTSKLWSLGGLVGVYSALSVWAYFAWYYDMPRTDFTVNGDGWFGRKTYAGGADKLGHFWSNHAISRIGSEILMRGGWKPLPASLISSGLSFSMFAFVEVKDGYYYEFSMGDFLANTAGAALSALEVNVPAIDRWIDFQVEYVPSSLYLHGLTHDGDLDVAEDYSGQTYELAVHLAAVPGLWRGFDYVDLVGGFKSRHYKPIPDDPRTIRSQQLFFGVALNMQALFKEAFGDSDHGWRRAGHLAFEFYRPPYTTLPAVTARRLSMKP